MKKLLLILLCVPLIFSSCENNQKTSLDINIDNLKVPCDFIDALSEVIQDMYNLGEENKWEPLSEGSKELNQAKDLWKKSLEIRSAGGEMVWKMSQSEIEKCDSYTDKIEDKRDKIGDWIQTFQEFLE